MARKLKNAGVSGAVAKRELPFTTEIQELEKYKDLVEGILSSGISIEAIQQLVDKDLLGFYLRGRGGNFQQRIDIIDFIRNQFTAKPLKMRGNVFLDKLAEVLVDGGLTFRGAHSHQVNRLVDVAGLYLNGSVEEIKKLLRSDFSFHPKNVDEDSIYQFSHGKLRLVTDETSKSKDFYYGVSSHFKFRQQPQSHFDMLLLTDYHFETFAFGKFHLKFHPFNRVSYRALDIRSDAERTIEVNNKWPSNLLADTSLYFGKVLSHVHGFTPEVSQLVEDFLSFHRRIDSDGFNLHKSEERTARAVEEIKVGAALSRALSKNLAAQTSGFYHFVAEMTSKTFQESYYTGERNWTKFNGHRWWTSVGSKLDTWMLAEMGSIRKNRAFQETWYTRPEEAILFTISNSLDLKNVEKVEEISNMLRGVLLNTGGCNVAELNPRLSRGYNNSMPDIYITIGLLEEYVRGNQDYPTLPEVTIRIRQSPEKEKHRAKEDMVPIIRQWLAPFFTELLSFNILIETDEIPLWVPDRNQFV